MTKRINFSTALSVVIANMVGTGVFTSLGFQIGDIKDYAALIFLWLLGGIISLFGAFSYAELGAAMPQSGGEYNFLSKIFHPSIGFLSGWVSATIGFAAPIALAASALAKYTNTIYEIDGRLLGTAVIIIITIFQSIGHHVGGTFQTIVTSLKILLIVIFIVCGFVLATPQPNITFLPTADTHSFIFSGAFAISMFFVAFSYSGWNAAAYIAGEIENPQRNVPLALFAGTGIVTVLYVLVNFIFLYTAPASELAGQLEVGFVSAKHIFGDNGAKVISGFISMLLVSTISSMIIAGPRVISAIGNDFSVFKIAAKTNKHGIPVYAIWIQSAIALILLYSGSFDFILNCTTFVLILFSTITVLGVFVSRIQSPDLVRPYKAWGYPFTPALYIVANLWFLYFALKWKQQESLIGLGIVATGLVVYFVAKKLSKDGDVKTIS
jgi:APA family basic amino acid/polyamine antiporter